MALEVDLLRGVVAAGIMCCNPLGPRGRGLIGFISRDGVAPVGRDHSIVRVDDTESRRKATNHTARSVGSTRVFIDTLDENVIRRGRLSELQNDLVRPVAHVVCQDLVALGALPVTHDRNAAIKLFPELERDRGDFDVTNQVPCDKSVVQLLGGVEGSEELRLFDKRK